MLEVRGIDVYYGKVKVLHSVAFNVGNAEIVSIIGSNGAGKSSLMKTIMGMNSPAKGDIVYDGKKISGLPSHRIVAEGIVYVPEGREVFSRMSVRDNLLMGAYSKAYQKKELEEHLTEMYRLFPRLQERQRQQAGSLSGGEQQMVAIARGLMSDPRLIMFDEPSLGLAPVIVDEMFETILRINELRRIPIVIVEQNAFMAMSISDRTYVLETGRVIDEGPSLDLLESPKVKKAYLGG